MNQRSEGILEGFERTGQVTNDELPWGMSSNGSGLDTSEVSVSSSNNAIVARAYLNMKRRSENIFEHLERSKKTVR
jgi:hypothetical protein